MDTLPICAFVMKVFKIILVFFLPTFLLAQNQDKNWYFGTGTDGIVFNNQNQLVKVNNKFPGVGFEGNATASDPCTGQLLFYTDGIKVIDSNHQLMSNGTGLLSNVSGSQCVQICKVPGTCGQYYIISNSSWDNTPGSFYYSIVDFNTNPLGDVTIKNQLIYGPNYHQAMRVIPKTNSNNLWLIGHIYNTATYHVFEITSAGFIGPVVYNFTNAGRSWTMEYNAATHKLVNMGEDSLKVSLFDFDPATGVLSNEQQLLNMNLIADVGNFSPDGSKLYAGLAPTPLVPGFLWQYDFNTSVWTNMNTCCWAHDVKTGPDGVTYFIHTYNSPNPLAQMTNSNLTAVGNACGYATISPGTFNGEVRRFPEFLQVPDPPEANADGLTVAAGGSLTISPLANDFDPQGDTLSVTAIISGPNYGTATLNGNQISYTANNGICNQTDSILYEVLDNTCMCDTAYIIINIQGNAPQSAFVYSMTSCSSTVIFTDSSSGGINFNWDFGDGTFQTGTSVTHTYQQSGTYSVTLVTSGACGSDTAVNQVTVQTGTQPVAAFTSSQLNCSSIITFTDQSAGAATHSWNFGDGFSDTIASPSHNYATAGTYNVSLLVSNNCSSDTISQQVVINPIPQPAAVISAQQLNCSLDEGFSSQIVNAVGYSWDFGDQSTDTARNPLHTYSSTGTYQVRFIIHGTCINDTVTTTINIMTAPNAVSQFNFITTYCSNSVTFENHSINATQYSWDFGDSATSAVADPQHTFSHTGLYSVRLIAANQCGTDTIVQLVPDTFSAAISNFNVEQPACESSIRFIDNSSNAQSWYWNFGDGVISKEHYPTHAYREAGDYTVTLCINRGSLCTDTTNLVVHSERPYDPHFYVPNCFTPNGDGINDIWQIVSSGNCNMYQLYIYNRWGNMIYQTDDLLNAWDGVIDGDQAQCGVYCFIIKGNEYERTGSVAIIR
jgi:gliding motility-associated-like protein